MNNIFSATIDTATLHTEAIQETGAHRTTRDFSSDSLHTVRSGRSGDNRTGSTKRDISSLEKGAKSGNAIRVSENVYIVRGLSNTNNAQLSEYASRETFLYRIETRTRTTENPVFMYRQLGLTVGVVWGESAKTTLEYLGINIVTRKKAGLKQLESQNTLPEIQSWQVMNEYAPSAKTFEQYDNATNEAIQLVTTVESFHGIVPLPLAGEKPHRFAGMTRNSPEFIQAVTLIMHKPKATFELMASERTAKTRQAITISYTDKGTGQHPARPSTFTHSVGNKRTDTAPNEKELENSIVFDLASSCVEYMLITTVRDAIATTSPQTELETRLAKLARLNRLTDKLRHALNKRQEVAFQALTDAKELTATYGTQSQEISLHFKTEYERHINKARSLSARIKKIDVSVKRQAATIAKELRLSNEKAEKRVKANEAQKRYEDKQRETNEEFVKNNSVRVSIYNAKKRVEKSIDELRAEIEFVKAATNEADKADSASIIELSNRIIDRANSSLALNEINDKLLKNLKLVLPQLKAEKKTLSGYRATLIKRAATSTSADKAVDAVIEHAGKN